MLICIREEKGYFEDVATNGQIEIHLQWIVLGCVHCILIVLSRDKKRDILNPLKKPSMSYVWEIFT